MTNSELIALLRESRKSVVQSVPSFAWEKDEVVEQQNRLELLSRIDAALAAHDAVPPSEERVDSTTPVVESADPWWSPSSHRAQEGACDLHVWRMSLKEWGWSTTVYRDHERGREDLGSGVCNTLDEAQRAALAAARGMR